MTITDLQINCPAAFASAPSRHLSGQYHFIPSVPVIESLYSRGFEATSVRSIGGKRSGLGAHMIRFREPNKRQPIEIGDAVPEVVLYNSHDGSRRFVLTTGLFRLVCSNGLVTSHWSGQGAAIKRKHLGSFDHNEEITRTLEAFPQVYETVNRLKNHQNSQADTQRLIIAGLSAREGSEIPVGMLDFNHWSSVRREADHGDSMWLVLNRVQENLIRGFSNRGINDPNKVYAINTALWSTAVDITKN